MSENCDGAEIVLKKRTPSSECSAREYSSGKDLAKEFAPESKFRGFVLVPQVRVERFNITPYLNGNKQPRIEKETTKIIGGKAVELHLKRLSQKCVVRLKNNDLEKLRASLKRPGSPTSSYDSDNSTKIAMKCKICGKTYDSARKLLSHQQNKHIVISDRKSRKRVSFSDHVIVHEYHKCRKCPKIFEEYQLLRIHMKHDHKKRKCYICNYCEKKFVDRMFFKVHIRLHCDVCGKMFANKTKCVDHRRNVCRMVKMHKCNICDESFFKAMDLKDHSYEHDNLLYVCDICKDPFQSKCEITHHISFLHSKKRPKELYTMRKMGLDRLYLCQFCDESSVEREIIESHIQNLPDLMNKAMTGYKDYYFCEHCMTKFDTEKDMLQHKWTHFLKTEPPLKSILTKRPNVKKTYNVKDKVPESMLPVIRLEKVKVDELASNVDTVASNVDSIASNIDTFAPNIDIDNFDLTLDSDINEALQNVDVNTLKKKALVDPKSKKTIVSKHQCQTCDKYFSNNYCLNRHIATQHNDFENLRCKVCEETFVWPSLLKSHKCIRLKHPELPFDDARPEIYFDNNTTFDDLSIEESDYMNSIDFEIPAPIVELRECDSTFNSRNELAQKEVSSSGYRLVMQEVPIEF